MRHLVLAALILAWPALAAAQHWATREVCTVDTPAIHADLFTAPGIDALREQARQIPNNTGRYWQITAPSGAVSHLHGTFHTSDRHILDLPPRVRADIARSRLVAVEVDFTAPTRRHIRALGDRDQIWRDARSNFKFDTVGLPPRITSMIRSRTSGLGWTPEAPDYLTFGGLAELLLPDPCSDFTAGVIPFQDALIQTLGHIAGADLLGLEPRDAFRATLDRRDRQDTAIAILAVYGAYLTPMTDNRPRATNIAMYLRGELGLMSLTDRAFLQTQFGQADGSQLQSIVDDYMLRERNETFLATARDALDTGGVFMAIGSAHLPGTTGMIELLRAAGFTVTRIPLPGEAP
ncbi:TraB/GumN family protein [Pseudaestuariivita atlantica]|uniref:Polysaccharide biosynthesis protein GumN n=1 Tax=Pseudaestuariivita atlantica TaxID=1317121 RepID=A0A0L1JRA5_9RHOB|nr:TraB/GumN family protein [Pseudaestuariivita atlantica]KNG94280.1 hypothetical protein ATO11_08725 [Pseudaestuariivita atlantica]